MSTRLNTLNIKKSTSTITLKNKNYENNNNNNNNNKNDNLLTINKRIKNISRAYKLLFDAKSCEILSSLDSKGLRVNSIEEESQSGTKSKLYFLKYKKNNLFVKKVLIDDKGDNCCEMNIYKLLFNFLRLKISPHVITGIHNLICESNGHKYELLFTETFDKERFEICSFTDFIEKYLNQTDNININLIILNLIFQIIYTLVCFYFIGLQHNDLHTGNILICINKENNILHNSEFKPIFYTSYTYEIEKHINLCDLGIYAYIFDFNISHKINMIKEKKAVMQRNTNNKIKNTLRNGNQIPKFKFPAERIQEIFKTDIRTFFTNVKQYYKNYESFSAKYTGNKSALDYLTQILLTQLYDIQSKYLKSKSLDISELHIHPDSFNILNIFNN